MESSLTQVGISFTKQKNGVVSGSKKKKKKFFLYKVEGVFGDRLFNYWCLDKEKKNLSTLVNFKGSLLCKLVKKDM